MILITGGAGYIGSHTVRLLCELGQECVVFDNLIYGHEQAVDKRAKFYKGDLLNPKDLNYVFSTYNITAVIHFAAYAYVGESVVDPSKYYTNNVVGSINLLNAMMKFNVHNIVFSSTCATYGSPMYLPIDEQHPQCPINPYGTTKLIIENLLSDFHKAYGINYIALRYFNAAGAINDSSLGESHNPETHLIPRVMQAIMRKIPQIEVFGTNCDTKDGTCIRDYIHVTDLADAHIKALDKLSSFSGCINLGTGIGTSVREIIEQSELISGKKCPTVFKEKRAGDPDSLFANNRLAQEILNWHPKYTSLKDIITTSWNWENNRKY